MTSVRDIVLLGSTGSIGTQALDVVARNPDRFRVVGLAAGGGDVALLVDARGDADRDLAEHPRGEVGVGIGSNGRNSTFGEITFSSDYLQGKDPDQVYQNCVYHRSGEMPTRPYSSIPAKRY